MNQVAQHYGERGGLLDRIAEGLARIGKTLDDATTEALAAVDEFHIRGRKATWELAEGIEISYHWIPREQNKRADILSNEGIDGAK